MPSFLVIGGTGKTGSRVAARLLDDGHQVRVASRSAASATTIAFDWHDEAGHDAALARIDGVYLVAPPGSPDVVSVVEPFIHRALRLGVTRFVLLSSSAIAEGGPAMGMVHQLLRHCAPEWAVLRPSWFMQNFSVGQHLHTIRDDGAIYTATGDGSVGFIDVDDIASVAAHVLTATGPLNGDAVLTGPAALSYDEIATIIGDARRQPVAHVRLNEAELADRWQSLGVGREYAQMLAAMDTAIAGGAEQSVTASVRAITGRSPRSFVDFATEHATVWRR